ncbi:MAG: flagellar hook-associated family protein [Rhizobiales bacterium]|nr:flagellar hook-associated family protein [Hyphomicrobiales bacterium]
MSQSLRLAMQQTQNDLDRAQSEVASGRHDDVALTLGAGTGRDLLWRSDLGGLRHMVDSNKLAGVRANLSQSALSSIRDAASTFLSTLTGARNAQGGQQLAATAAKSALDQLTSLLNTTHDGQYIFGGTNSQQPPLRDFATGGAQPAIENAFTTAFGLSPTNPAVVNITATAMQNFLDGSYAGLFAPPSWAGTWSNAADDAVVSRIDRDELVRASTTANIDPIRQLAEAFTTVASLGAPNLSQSAFETVVNEALSLAGAAVIGIGDEQARIGLAQNQISTASDRLQIRINALTGNVRAIEQVDKYEAATRANNLMTALESSYTLTGRISRLSLLNFL